MVVAKKNYFCSQTNSPMAEKEQDDLIMDVQDAYSKSESFVNENKNVLSTIGFALIAIVGGYFAYKNLYLQPKIQEANNLIWKAEYYFENDSLDKAINGDGNNFGFAYIADNFGGTPAGNLSEYYLGISYMRLGDYQKAIDFLSGASLNDALVASVALGSIGDCYVELGNLDKAVSYFEKAASNDNNELTTPLYMKKAGLVQMKLGNKDAALAMFTEIQESYPKSAEGKEMDKYIALAKI